MPVCPAGVYALELWIAWPVAPISLLLKPPGAAAFDTYSDLYVQVSRVLLLIHSLDSCNRPC
jgi:hypothetical protein